MKTRLSVAIALALFAVYPAFAQHGEAGHAQAPAAHVEVPHNAAAPRANQGHIPPAPPVRTTKGAKPEGEKIAGHLNNTPHVNNDHWYGHDKPNDARYKVAHPFEHGHFTAFGPDHRYNIVRIDRDAHRFWLPGGFYFDIAAWDWPICADWCWDCADDFVVYEDTDHPGWYLLYNVHTGVYVHVTYMGM
jgi:hypothetical protein